MDKQILLSLYYRILFRDQKKQAVNSYNKMGEI